MLYGRTSSARKDSNNAHRAGRITEQASAENRHDNENKQRDGCRDQAGNRHGADRHLEQRVVVYFHQQVGKYVVSPHHDRTEQACRNTPEVAVRVQEQAQSAKAENSHDRRNCQQHVAQPVHRLVIRKTAASFLLFLADAKQTVDDILEYACRTYRGTINASEYQCQQEMEHDQATIPPNKAGISCRCSKRCTLFGKLLKSLQKKVWVQKRIASKPLNPFR